MTQMQRIRVDQIKQVHGEHCAKFFEFGSGNYCTLEVMVNKSSQMDDNVVVLMNKITDIDDSGVPLTSHVQVVIDPQGETFPLNELITDDQMRLKYLQGLTQIE
jgi:hypothetical protein